MKKKNVVDWIKRSKNQAWEQENQARFDTDPRKLQLDSGTHLPSKPYRKQEPIYATADDPDTGSHDMVAISRDTKSAGMQPGGFDRSRMDLGSDSARMEPESHNRGGMELESNRMDQGSQWSGRMEPEKRDRTRTEPSINSQPRIEQDRSRIESGGRDRHWSTNANAQNQNRVPHEWRAARLEHRYGMENRARVATVSGSHPASSQFRYPQAAHHMSGPAHHMPGMQGRGERRAPNQQKTIDPMAKFGKDYYVLDV